MLHIQENKLINYLKDLKQQLDSSTVDIVLGNFKQPLPKHTLRYYISELIIIYNPFNVDLLIQWLQEIDFSINNSDYYKKPVIKQPEYVKLSKSEL